MNLEEHIKKNCDPKLMGVLSFGIKEAYNEFNKFIETKPMFQTQAMSQIRGHMLKGMIDLTLPQVLSNSGIEYRARDSDECKFKNGKTFFVAEVKGATITPKKLAKINDFPEKANYRTILAEMNRGITLFDDGEDLYGSNFEYDPYVTPSLILTHGNVNQNLKWINISLPDFEMKQWIGSVDITNVPVLITNQKAIKEEISLSFTENAERIIGEGEQNAKGKII